MAKHGVRIGVAFMACIGLATGASAQGSEPRAVGNFMVSTNTDPITDESRGVAGASDESGDIKLGWHCNEGDVIVTLKVGVPGGDEDVPIVYRFDQDRPDTTMALGVKGSSGSIRLLSSALIYPFTQRARSAGRLVVREFDASARPSDYIISLAGSERALTQLPCVRALRPTSRRASVYDEVEPMVIPVSSDTCPAPVEKKKVRPEE
ncbi:MAG TPA: hypothetical protein VF625_16650 [Longimicrobium sp.]